MNDNFENERLKKKRTKWSLTNADQQNENSRTRAHLLVHPIMCSVHNAQMFTNNRGVENVRFRSGVRKLF